MVLDEGGGGGVPRVDGVPAVNGIAAFFEELDRLVRRRPRRGRVPIPAIVLHGELADDVVTGYGRRLTVGRRAAVPHATCRCDQRSDLDDDPNLLQDIALFDRIADRLCDTLPEGRRGMAGMRGLRLPRYRTVRHILDSQHSHRSRAERRKELSHGLYQRRRELGWPAGWLGAFGAWLSRRTVLNFDLGFLGDVVTAAGVPLFRTRLRASRQMSWLRKVVKDAIGDRGPFLDTALQLVTDGPERADDVLIPQVLMQALLRDLQAATGRVMLSPSPFRRRRVTPFVVLLEHVVAGSPGYRAIETFTSIVADTAHRTRRRHTVMVLASLGPNVTPGEAPVPDGTPRVSLGEAAPELAPLADHGRELAFHALLVETPADDIANHSAADERALSRRRTVDPMPVRGAVAVPVMYGVVTLLVATCIAICRESSDRCPGLDEVGGETVGIGDGRAQCTFFGDADHIPADLRDRLVDVEKAIADQNADVLEIVRNDQERRYATIVFYAPLTVPEGPERDENPLNQLRGIYLAQQHANELADDDENRALTRVLIANPGASFAYEDQATAEIVAAAEDDETIIGVVGISQSRQRSVAAVEELGSEGLPVVAGPVTGDQMIDASPHYYQVSPRNWRVAQMLVEFSNHTRIVGVGDDSDFPDGAVITFDHSDLYSDNLADDLRIQLGDRVLDMVSYPVDDEDAPLPAPEMDEPSPTRVTSLAELADEVCASLEEDDILYFTNRSSQYVGLLHNMRENTACPPSFTVVAGSAVTKLLENQPNLMSASEFQGVELYYAAFASRHVEYSQRSIDFVRDYDEAYREDTGSSSTTGVGTDVSDAALAYDAFIALQDTANNAVEDEFTPSAGLSAQELGNGEIEFNGASGYIALGDASLDNESAEIDSGSDEYERVPDLKPVLVIHAGDPQAPVLQCGRFSRTDNRDTWGPDNRSCPTEN